eukprot:1240089-Amphidinium_carterae.2
MFHVCAPPDVSKLASQLYNPLVYLTHCERHSSWLSGRGALSIIHVWLACSICALVSVHSVSKSTPTTPKHEPNLVLRRCNRWGLHVVMTHVYFHLLHVAVLKTLGQA